MEKRHAEFFEKLRALLAKYEVLIQGDGYNEGEDSIHFSFSDGNHFCFEGKMSKDFNIEHVELIQYVELY